jgi:hypothetical protein
MNKPEPTRLKLNPENPTTKNVNKLPLLPLDGRNFNDLFPEEQIYDINMKDDIYIRPDNDSIYKPVDKKN